MKLHERFTTVDDLARDIPVFPLRGAILLPRANLPLNIFEPRYLELFDEAISGSRLVGIIQPDRSFGESESPAGRAVPLRRIGCVGRLTAFQEVDDGRVIVSLAGVARFSVVAELDSGRQYRICQVDYTRFSGDLNAGVGGDDVDREGLLNALRTFLDARKLRADWAAISKSPNELLVNALSIMSPFGPEEKQALLEAVDLKTRAEVLVALAEMELATEGSGGSGPTLQ